MKNWYRFNRSRRGFQWITFWCGIQFLLSGASGAREAGPAARQVSVAATAIQWTAGQRITVTPEAGEVTPEGQKALRVAISGPPSPGDRSAKAYSLSGRGLRTAFPTEDQAAWVSTIRFWFKSLRPSDEPLTFVMRQGYGDRVSLQPTGWRKVELRTWGPQRLAIGDVEEIAVRTANVPDGTQFLLGPLVFEITDEAAEAAKWMPATSDSFTINGLWWIKENGGTYARLPQRPGGFDRLQDVIRRYTEYPAGARVRFQTASSSLQLRIDHGGDALAWKELSVMAMAGIELYEGPPQRMAFRQISRPASGRDRYVVEFGPFPDRRLREFTLYLPMYAKLHSLEIAVDPDASIGRPSPFAIAKPVVFYGTSFIQGGGASRASMNLPALIGRMLAVDTINLGFAGDGRCEPELAQLIAEIDAACFVMGPILNNLELMRENYPRFVATLRQRWPDRPILLMSRLHTVGQSEPYAVNQLVREVYEKCRAGGDRAITFFDSFPLYGDGSVHPTVEGLHPSDLGYKMIADALAPEIARLCKLPKP